MQKAQCLSSIRKRVTICLPSCTKPAQKKGRHAVDDDKIADDRQSPGSSVRVIRHQDPRILQRSVACLREALPSIIDHHHSMNGFQGHASLLHLDFGNEIFSRDSGGRSVNLTAADDGDDMQAHWSYISRMPETITAALLMSRSCYYRHCLPVTSFSPFAGPTSSFA